MEQKNEKSNLEVIADQILYSGFEEKDLIAKVLKAMNDGKKEFQLPYSKEYTEPDGAVEKVQATLNFKLHGESGRYYFNSYDFKMKKGENDVQQRFYINFGKNVTLREAFNLMSGRAVNKNFSLKPTEEQIAKGEFPTYNAWAKINFNATDKNGNFKMDKYGENYGFNLKEAMKEVPYKIKDHEQSDGLFLRANLRKGNLQKVTFQVGKEEVQGFITVDPKFKKVNCYDENMTRMSLNPEVLKQQKAAQQNKKGINAGKQQPDVKVNAKKSRGQSV